MLSLGRSVFRRHRESESQIWPGIGCVAGLVLGIRWGSHAGVLSDSWMLGALTTPMSICGLATVSLLPFLVTVFLILLPRPWPLILFLFGKMISFGFCATAVYSAFGYAGWLVRFLLMFSDSLMLPMLCYLALRRWGGKVSRWELFLGFLWTLLVGWLDFRLVSPFLAAL